MRDKEFHKVEFWGGRQVANLTRTKLREQEAAPGLKYDVAYQKRGDFIEHSMTGQIVIKDSDREWELARQGYHAIHKVGFNDTLANFPFARLIRGH